MLSAEEELRARDAEWLRCVQSRDIHGADSVLDDRYELRLMVPAATAIPRDAWLAMLPDYVVDEFEVLDQQVEVEGDLGIIFQRVRMKATVRGEDRSGIFVLTDVWLRSDVGWSVWRRYSTPISAGALPL